MENAIMGLPESAVEFARVPGLVSVIMPAYNREELLAESINSVIAQTYKQWELLVVDDASTDRTLAVSQLMANKDSRIRVISVSKNEGEANARNVGMQVASGQFLAFLDSDDLWLPEKLEVQVEFMRQRDIGFSFCRYRRVGPDGSVGAAIRIPDQIGYKDLLRFNVIGCLTVMIDRNKIPPFTMRKGGYDDYHAWLQILKSGHTAWGLQKDLGRYRLSQKSVSSNKLRSALRTWRTYRNLENLPPGKALWCLTSHLALSAFKRLIG